MSSPKYSVVMPILNGAEALQKTFPEMLKTERDDVEFVVSNNLSDDKTKEIILDQNDKRVKYFEPESRLGMRDSLTFAYSHATGNWVNHLGHDDYIMSSRFDILDVLIDETQADVIRGEAMHYNWPEYPFPDKANTISPEKYNNQIALFTGKEIAYELINIPGIHCGGAWCVKKKIMDEVSSRTIQFSNLPPELEFFLMRAACVLAEKVITINYPLYVHGRHSSSSGTRIRNNDWKWDTEGHAYNEYCPFKYDGYVTDTLGASLHVMDVFSEEFKDAKIDWWKWVRSAEYEMSQLIYKGYYPPEAMKLFYDGLKKTPIPKTIYELFRALRWIFRKITMRHPDIKEFFGDVNIVKSDKFFNDGNTWGWIDYLDGKAVGINSIIDIPDFLEKNFNNPISGKKI